MPDRPRPVPPVAPRDPADDAEGGDRESRVEQLLLAVTGGVGPAPALAPGSMSELGLAIALATFRHPALEARASIGLRSA